MTARELDRSPALASAAISVLAALIAVAVLGPGAVLVFSVPGAILVGTGIARSSRRTVDYGALCIFAGVAVAGINGGSPVQLVPGTLATIVAWDAGGYGIALGRQLGRAAETERAEVVHSALTFGVGASAAIVGFGVYSRLSGGQPVIALLLLLVGTILLVVALR